MFRTSALGVYSAYSVVQDIGLKSGRQFSAIAQGATAISGVDPKESATL